jgi:hypothetical protein
MNYQRHKIYTSRDTTPRQFRLAAQRDARKATTQRIFSAIAGGILIGLLIICLSFL